MIYIYIYMYTSLHSIYIIIYHCISLYIIINDCILNISSIYSQYDLAMWKKPGRIPRSSHELTSQGRPSSRRIRRHQVPIWRNSHSSFWLWGEDMVIYPLVMTKHNYGKSPWKMMGKSTISMAISNSYVSLPEGIYQKLEIPPTSIHGIIELGDFAAHYGTEYQRESQFLAVLIWLVVSNILYFP